MRLSLPPSFMSTARRLLRRRGVVGVFWGAKHPGEGGRNHVRVHVQEKIDRALLPATRVLAKRIDGLPTCVVGVGHPTGQDLSLKQQVQPDGEQRFSTLTMLARDDGRWRALVSGHGTLPIRGGALVTPYDGAPATEPIALHDVSSGMDLSGRLAAGRIAPGLDFAIVDVDVPDGVEVELTCPATGTSRPRIRLTDLERDEPVQHYSSRSPAMHTGRAVAIGLVDLKLDDGRQHRFTHLYEVRGDGGPFSASGDSGSLVADLHGHAVGVVIGGSAPDHIPNRTSYVLPFLAPDGSVPPQLVPFFS